MRAVRLAVVAATGAFGLTGTGAHAGTEQGGAPVGACCTVDGVCTDGITFSNCSDVGGYWNVEQTCLENACGFAGACCVNGLCNPGESYGYCQFAAGGTWVPVCGDPRCNPVGACCFGNGQCIEQSQNLCFLNGGEFQGEATTCSEGACTGSCCLPNFGGCVEISLDLCNAAEGQFNGFQSVCNGFQCPEACCLPAGYCQELTPYDCFITGGTFIGGGCSAETKCVATAGACCFGAFGCSDGVDPFICKIEGGQFQGLGSVCNKGSCQPSGACCYDGSFCALVLEESQCTFGGGTYLGDGSFCPVNGCCPADLNHDGTVNTADLTLLLVRFGQSFPLGTEPADINQDGAVNTSDLILLLAAFGRPCA